MDVGFIEPFKSQPSWAAWIEIYALVLYRKFRRPSQPSWAAWIEMLINAAGKRSFAVAALLGCVD